MCKNIRYRGKTEEELRKKQFIKYRTGTALRGKEVKYK